MLAASLHPATRLLIWLATLIAAQCLSGVPLLVALSASLLSGTVVIRRGGRLVWRARWLLCSLFVVFAWGTAGNALWASDWAPTDEGLRDALTHLGRLVLVLMVVAAFLEKMSLSDLLTGTHTALSPFAYLGFDPDRGVVRLMLALRYAETLPRPRDWKALLTMPDTTMEDAVEVRRLGFGWRDFAVAMAVALALCLYCMR